MELKSIYIYTKGNFKFYPKTLLRGNPKGQMRFGTSVANLNDINNDGYNGNATTIVYFIESVIWWLYASGILIP